MSSQPKTFVSPYPLQATRLLNLIGRNCSLFLLLIAIDKYPNQVPPPLHGCTADAQDVETYFQEIFDVRSKSIYDQEATRNAILESLRSIAKDPKIQKGDPIVIFYAGHGGGGRAPPEWDTGDDKIQYLVPHDFKFDGTSGAIQNEIMDFEIGEILEEIATEKGNNIVSHSPNYQILRRIDIA